MMTTDAESSSRRGWVKKLKLIPLANSSRATSSELLEASIRTALPWSRVSSPTTESNSSSLLALVGTEPRELERERESPSEDALLVLISKLFPLFSSRREKRKFPGLPTKPNPEDLDPRDPLESENSTESKKLKMKRLFPAHVPSSKSTLLEEPSKVKRMLLLQLELKLPRSRDLSLRQDSEERESRRRTKSRDGKELLLWPKNTRSFTTPGLPRKEKNLRESEKPPRPLTNPLRPPRRKSPRRPQLPPQLKLQ